MTNNKKITTYISALLSTFCLLLALPSMADFTLMEVLITESKNDCASKGYFHNSANGSGFSACEIFYKDSTTGDSQYLTIDSAVLNKYEDSKWVQEDNSLSLDMSDNKTGQWSKNSNTTDFPDIRFWTAKAGTDFKLFWMVDSTTVGSACDTVFSFACLDLAQTVTSGSWTTPVDKNGKNRSLSHLTFFGGPGTDCTTNCGPAVVPEPQTIILFALAILALIFRQRRLKLVK